MVLEYIQDILNCGLKDNPQNKLFGKISSAIGNAAKIPAVYDLWAMLSSEDESEENTETEKISTNQDEAIRDFRIKLVTFSNFRKFPDYGKDGISFGLPFYKLNNKGIKHYLSRIDLRDQEPLSAVLLGANGVGKTSVYTAIEAVAYGYSYIAEAHGFKSIAEQKKYFCNGSGEKESKAKFYTKCQDITYSAQQKDVLQPAFFCSEYDIYIIQQYQITSQYLFNQLGKGYLIELHAKLSKLLPLFGIIANIRKLKEALNTPGIDGEKRNSLEKQLNDRKSEGRRFLEVDKWLSNYESPVAQKHEVELKSVVEYLQSKINDTLNALQPIAENFLSALLAPFIKDDGGKIVVKKENNTLTINIAFTKSDGSIYSLEPRQYFNTFRVKVFAVALKVALSCCIRIQNNMNFPIILDDTFDASDFNTKYKIRDFINILVTRYNSLSELKPYPLQLIFFTQDDIVAENAYLGFMDSNSEAIYSRIFDHSQCNDNDVSKIKYGNLFVEYVCISDNIK